MKDEEARKRKRFPGSDEIIKVRKNKTTRCAVCPFLDSCWHWQL
jgi:hypothetical protein